MTGIEIITAPDSSLLNGLVFAFAAVFALGGGVLLAFAGTFQTTKARAATVAGWVVVALLVATATTTLSATFSARDDVQAARAQTIDRLQEHYDVEVSPSSIPGRTPGVELIAAIDRRTGDALVLVARSDGHRITLLGAETSGPDGEFRAGDTRS